MSANEKQELTFVWKIKHFHRIHSTEFHGIISPSFEVEFLKDVEWRLLLTKGSQNILCCINRTGCSKLPECISVNYRYELATSEDVILKTSDILSDIFKNDSFSSLYEFKKLANNFPPEDIYLRCRMEMPCISPSMQSTPCSVVGWEAETDLLCSPYSFTLSLNSDFMKLTAVEKVRVESLPIDIVFKYEKNELQFELVSNIQDNTYHTVFCTISLNDEKSVLVKENFDGFKFSYTKKLWKFPHFVNKQHLEKANCFTLKQINLRFHFVYRDHSSIVETPKDVSSNVKYASMTQFKNEAENVLHLQQQLRNMLTERTYADVKLRADDEVFFAHKCLLAARSPVFRAMFDQDMLESKTGIIDIHDADAKILKVFLEYLYTGTVDDMNAEKALSLLVVADKYQVLSLTDNCSTFLKSVFSVDNVLNVLLIADMVNQERLKGSAVEYIVENSRQVLSSPNWPQWLKTNSAIASEVLLKLSEKFDSSSKSNTV